MHACVRSANRWNVGVRDNSLLQGSFDDVLLTEDVQLIMLSVTDSIYWRLCHKTRMLHMSQWQRMFCM